MAVKVAVQGSAVINFPYQGGLTLGAILDTSRIETSERSTMTVNSVRATRATPVPDESVVVITPNIQNG